MSTEDSAQAEAGERTSLGDNPLVSVVVPTYNRAHMLPKAVGTILSQTYRNVEVVIVNDGSPDGTHEVLEGLTASDSRVSAYEKPNGGIAQTLNYGFARAKGQLVTWNSDDNYFHPEALEMMVAYLKEHPDVDFVYTDVRDVDADGNEIAMYEAGPPENLLRYCNVRGCLLYRREVNDIVGLYDSKWPTVQDYNFYRRAYDKVKMGYIPKAPYDYTVHGASMSGPHVDCVWEFGRHQHGFAKTRAERRANWAWCFAEIARTERSHGRKWHAVWYRLRAMLCDGSKWREFWAEFWRTGYASTPEVVKLGWRFVKARS